jgi:2-polyprenyl-3-methyl-5-hydroxy-6-metoxy-1,4-benzoquinol methylase
MASAEKFWDRLASRWDKRTDLEQPDSAVVTRTRALLHEGDRVLDYGCAAGSVALRLARSVASIHGIDISSNMIAAAQRREDLKKTGNSTFARATIFDPALLPSSYDAVLAFAMFHLLEDTDRVLERIAELLRPGGVLISVTPCPSGEKASLAGRSFVPIVRVGSWAGVIPRVRVFSVAGLVKALTAAGFRVTEVDKLPHSTPDYFVVAEKL